jgi:hypothetical protein
LGQWNLTKKKVHKFLLATGNAGRTVFLEAAKSINEELFQGILNWAKKSLTKEEVNKFLLVTVNAVRTAFHVAAENYKVEVFQGIFNWAK